MFKTLLVLLAGAAVAAEIKPLPAPIVTGGMPLMEAINARKSGREYNPNHKIDDQTLSEILWVAWGISAHGNRTIPTSRNTQNMGLYVLTTEGTWRYNAADNCLEKVNDKNLIPLCEKQDYVKNAPLHLLFTAKDDYAGRSHVGSAYQNVYLYATSKGINTVIRAMIDTAALTREMNLPDGQVVIAHQTLGYAE